MTAVIFSIIIALLLFSRFCICIEELDLLESDQNQKKLNVIVFFAHVDPDCMVLRKDALGCLDLHEKTRLQFCEESGKSDDLEEDIETNQEGCKERLEESMTTLCQFCHTVMKMKTAIASVSSNEIANERQEIRIPIRISHNELNGDSNLYRAKRFRGPKTVKIVPENKEPKSTARNVITGNKHTEVFQIRVKRKASDGENFREEFDEELPKKHSNKYDWDVLDIMKHVRYSFLGKLLENEGQNAADQEDLEDISNLGKEKQDPGLFSMVNQTLFTLLEPPENSFFMVIFGGHLNSVTDKHSPLVQSIKHVIENTEDAETLIIVTGSCTEKQSDPKKDYERGTYTMPLYAKGPGSDLLSECSLLYDVPLAIKKILKKHTGIGKKQRSLLPFYLVKSF